MCRSFWLHSTLLYIVYIYGERELTTVFNRCSDCIQKFEQIKGFSCITPALGSLLKYLWTIHIKGPIMVQVQLHQLMVVFLFFFFKQFTSWIVRDSYTVNHPNLNTLNTELVWSKSLYVNNLFKLLTNFSKP